MGDYSRSTSEGFWFDRKKIYTELLGMILMNNSNTAENINRHADT